MQSSALSCCWTRGRDFHPAISERSLMEATGAVWPGSQLSFQAVCWYQTVSIAVHLFHCQNSLPSAHPDIAHSSSLCTGTLHRHYPQLQLQDYPRVSLKFSPSVMTLDRHFSHRIWKRPCPCFLNGNLFKHGSRAGHYKNHFIHMLHTPDPSGSSPEALAPETSIHQYHPSHYTPCNHGVLKGSISMTI